MTALANIVFALAPSAIGVLGLSPKVFAVVLLWTLAFLWGVTGWFQSAGFPAVAKSLTYWYSNSERGTKWAAWSCSHQTRYFLKFHYRRFYCCSLWMEICIFSSGYISCSYCTILCSERLRDRPQSLGLPDVEVYRNEPVKHQSAEDKKEEDEMSYVQIFKNMFYVIKQFGC